MNLVEESFNRLFPDKEFPFNAKLSFSAKFKPYNANVRKKGDNLEFYLSSSWKKINDEITIGLVQDLLIKILKVKGTRTTTNIDLYSKFVKNLHISAPKTAINPLLLKSFNSVNDAYFNGLLECPNLVFGHNSRNRLATYDYHTDTISVSNIFKNARREIIDYLVYHELLHKKLKFSSSNGKTVHHSHNFRKLERQFPGSKELEREINSFVNAKTFK